MGQIILIIVLSLGYLVDISPFQYWHINQIRIIQERPAKNAASSLEKTLVWTRCSYQVPVMVGTSDSKNDKYKFYNEMVHYISQWGIYYSIYVVALCMNFIDMEHLLKNKVSNCLENSLASWVIILMCTIKRFCADRFRASWWRRKKKHNRKTNFSSSYPNSIFIVLSADGSPKPIWPKTQV